uniref:N-acetyl-alpha-D-glucosaminyl L-malate synthase n=1 Tax=Vibrio parahaemolyticus TaxID=670 RepID=A0A7M1WEK5_VIBPH|nr:N-acetyl-alpha-D-glucosaminyl L-malate synthase [Vibrio parahaemolyticus]
MVIAPSKAYGGGEAYINNLVDKLHKNNVEVILFCASSILMKKVEGKVSRIILVPDFTSLGLSTITSIFKINQILKRDKIDAVFLNGLPEIGVYSRFISSNKIICIGHSNEEWLKEAWNKNLKRALKNIITFKFENHITKFIAINNIAMENVSHRENLFKNTEVIYNGVPEIKWSLNDETYSKNEIVFGRISRLCPGKGNEYLLSAFQRLCKKYNEQKFKLLIAGEGEEKNKLKKIVIDLGLKGKVDFLGHIAPLDFFKNIDCMVSPSDMEATPLVILEAMSCRIPILATNVGGVPELISHNVSGFLYESKSVSSCFNALEDYVLDINKYTTLSEHAYNEYLSKFTIEKCFNKTYSLICEVGERRNV